MVRKLSRLQGSAEKSLSDPSIIFAEQAIAMLRLTIDRMYSGENLGGVRLDLGDFVFILGGIVHRLALDDTSLRIKVRYSQLCELVFRKPDLVVVSNKGRFRNAILDWVTDWSSDASRVS